PPQDEALLSQRDDVVDEFWSVLTLGGEDLLRDRSIAIEKIWPELALRALSRLGVSTVCVPPSFPVGTADHLRANGITVDIDASLWRQRRRRKTPGELEGIERAQRACEAAFVTAARMLGDAQKTSDGRLRFEGEILTAEWIREAMEQELIVAGAECESILVQSGDACLSGHALGRGPIAPDSSCIIDCYPRDRRTGVYTDMTRTYVPGRVSHELAELHKHCRVALDIALESIKPGRSDAHAKVSEYFAGHGYPTEATGGTNVPLKEGFMHAVGHGVGLEIHEPPAMGKRAEELVAGDVVAIEPGLYFSSIGGVRLEDTVIVTDEGAEHFTDPLSYDLVP
ncbi:MAG: aminopeptidase P family protein, partial [Actinomycetota bacterium]|nr:aminopeptidase P family protein [Actinomycetota bacterium]